MSEREHLWLRAGLRQFQVVRCVVTEHRDRFGVDVEITSPVRYPNAFIDFVHLTDDDEHVRPEEFPPVGSVLDAITLDFMSDGELRLSARPAAVASSREEEEDTR